MHMQTSAHLVVQDPALVPPPFHKLLSINVQLQVRRASEATAAELKRQEEEQQQLVAGGAVGQELAVRTAATRYQAFIRVQSC